MTHLNPQRLNGWLAYLSISVILAGCALNKPSDLGVHDLRLYVLDCGYMDMQDWPAFQQLYGVPESVVAIPAQANPCFLIVNDGRSLLWDAGLPDATPRQPTQSAFGVKFEMPNKLKAQMEALGVPASELDYFALSHLHFDHVGNWAYFKHVETLLQRDEWTAAIQPSDKNIGYDDKITNGFKEYERLTLLDGDHDVFGDGLVTLVSTPGHTEGHQALIIKLQEYGPVIISGDAIHFTEELEHNVLPTFNTSADQSKASLQKLLELEASLGGELWIQHDPVQHQQRRIAPEFYR